MGEYYKMGDPTYEPIKVIQAWGLPFTLGCVLKYVARAGKKPGNPRLADLEKAKWYIEREIAAARASDAPPAQASACDHRWEYAGAGQGADSGEHYHKCALCGAWDTTYEETEETPRPVPCTHPDGHDWIASTGTCFREGCGATVYD